MKTSQLFLGAAAAAFLAMPAAAQDSGFSGPWVAGTVGYDQSRAGSTVDDEANEDNDESAEGVLYGVGVGYDYDLGNLVLGAEAEFTESTAETEFEDDDPEAFGLGRVETGRDIYVGARVGFKATPSTMVYAKGGYTNARFNFVGTDGTLDEEASLDTDGYRIGAGVEQRFGTNTFAKLEYRYSNYSKGEIDFETDGFDDSDRLNIDTDRHQVVASVGLRF